MSTWTIEQYNAVRVLRFARPPENFVNFAALIELGDLLEAAAADTSTTKLVVLASGTPGVFMNHADLDDLAKVGAGRATAAEQNSWSRALNLLEQIPQPTIAAIDGLASGGGNELALACTVRIGSPAARLQQPEVQIGLIPGGGGSVRLPRLVGPGVAAEILLTGREVPAQEAMDRGWLSVLLPGGNFDEEMLAWSDRVGQAPGSALNAVKVSIVQGTRLPFADAQQLERTHFAALSRQLAAGARQ